ncbi:hypothetical protein N9R79_07405 [Vibrio sp.]|nr:hypothetical protein [Vibrio sp.]
MHRFPCLKETVKHIIALSHDDIYNFDFKIKDYPTHLDHAFVIKDKIINIIFVILERKRPINYLVMKANKVLNSFIDIEYTKLHGSFSVTFGYYFLLELYSDEECRLILDECCQLNTDYQRLFIPTT